jgi:pimeloyl-ACP methyl ester carboxylesterase
VTDRPFSVGSEISVTPGGVQLDADLEVPDGATGIVVFAHGSGSSRRSPRNLQVAQALHAAGLGTLLFDLLTAREERRDAMNAADASLRFDIALLGDRLTGVVDELGTRPETARLPVALFGASTGAAAALLTAAARPEVVRSVVSRGGRPDLAGDALTRVHAPTLLLVGERDEQVLALNQAAAARLAGPYELSIVPGATHLFEEPGALEEVGRRASAWFTRTMPQGGTR